MYTNSTEPEASPDGAPPDEESLDSERQELLEDDQSASDRDQTTADRDQAGADRDQRASDGDQAAAARDAKPRERGADQAYPDDHLSRVQRLSGESVRHSTQTERDAASEEREITAKLRDENSAERDLLAARQELADAETQRQAAADTAAAKDALHRLTQLRTEAAQDRAEAASDREKAAEKRSLAGEKRRAALRDLDQATHPPMEGVLDRDAGDPALERKMREARAESKDFTMICLRVDGLDPEDGAGGGREALKDVADGIKANLPDGSPIVSFSDTEFVFTVIGPDGEDVYKAFQDLDPNTKREKDVMNIRVSRAQLESDDTFSSLLDRTFEGLIEEQPSSPSEDGRIA